MESPLVSVLTITYNSSKFLKQTLESILSQTFVNFEIIICDDNSTDNTWQIIEEFSDKRIKKIKNERNIGEYENRSKAVSLAKGQYCIFIDGDDFIYKNGLEFLISFALEHQDCEMIISKEWDERIIYPKKISSREFYQFEYFDRGICGINFTKVLFKTKPLQQEMPFIKEVKLGDLYIQNKLALIHNSLIIPDAATWWRRAAGQASEKLLKDTYYYLMHSVWIRLEMLNNIDCPLNAPEKEKAYNNIYGNLLRYLIRISLKLKISRAINLYKRYPVPSKYWLSIFKTQERNIFYNRTGNNPLMD